MKPSSSFSLLLFLQLASAAPMPEGLFPVDCHSTSCAAFRRFLSSTSNTPPTRLTSLHFPSHQLSSPDTLKSDGESFDHAPITPPPTTAPSSALSSEHPLISAFLVSLTSSFSQSAIQKAPLQKAPDEDEANALPVEPAAARKEDAARYWAALRPDSEKQANRGQTIGSDGPRHRVMLCGAQDLMSDYIALPRVLLTRDSTDLLVVCIVVLFMFALVALESVERFGFESGMLGTSRARRGVIYLADDYDEDDDEYTPGAISLEQVDEFLHNHIPVSHDEKKKEEEEGEEAFHYDSDADAKV